MSEADKELLAWKLSELFPGQIRRLIEPWEQCAWSKSYKVEFATREALYVKGTPRGRAEARITSLLHSYCPENIPAVVEGDLLPENEWQWFLLEDAGECNHTSITQECAVHAAYCLGSLQNEVCHHTEMAQYLPQCRADGLQETLVSVCDWALRTAPADTHKEILSFRTRAVHSTGYFRSLQQTLACLPATCIHGDFWSGNIACRDGTASFIDWGDAQWGVGSVSIVNLLASAGEELSGCADDIWRAYTRGWKRELTDEFVRASRAAALVSSLLVDVEIAKCCDGTIDLLPGLIPGLRGLRDLWE